MYEVIGQVPSFPLCLRVLFSMHGPFQLWLVQAVSHCLHKFEMFAMFAELMLYIMYSETSSLLNWILCLTNFVRQGNGLIFCLLSGRTDRLHKVFLWFVSFQRLVGLQWNFPCFYMYLAILRTLSAGLFISTWWSKSYCPWFCKLKLREVGIYFLPKNTILNIRFPFKSFNQH